jgi:hypothetical protein
MKHKGLLIAVAICVLLAGLFGWSVLGFFIWRSGVLASSGASHDASGFVVRFGILANDGSGNTYISQETTTIPMKYRDSNFQYGCKIFPPNTQPYTCWCVLHFPSPPKVLSGDGFASSEPSTTVRTIKIEAQGECTENFGFDEGDPLGPQSMDVYVNGQLVKTIHFTVVTADDGPGGN